MNDLAILIVTWIAGGILAAIDVAFIYLGVDVIAGYSMNWMIVLVAWWILNIHETDDLKGWAI